MKISRLILIVALVAVTPGACAGFDMEEFAAALEAENSVEETGAGDGDSGKSPSENSDTDVADSRTADLESEESSPDTADAEQSATHAVTAPRGRVFPESVAVSVDTSREIVAEPVELGFRPADVYFADAEYGWVVGEGGAISRTTDGGNSWERVDAAGLTESLQAVAFYDRLHGIVAGVGNVVGRTSDGGETWSVEVIERQVRIPEESFWHNYTEDGMPSQTHLFAAHAHGPDTFLVAGNFGQVFLYSNGSWEERTIITGQTVFGITSVSEGTILAATGLGIADNFGIERSAFGGPGWESIVDFTGPAARSISLSENGRLIAGEYPMLGDSYGDSTFSAPDRLTMEGNTEFEIARWSVGGIGEERAWVFQNPPFTGIPEDGNGLTLIYSGDGGDSWTGYGSRINAGMTSGAMLAEGHAVAVLVIPGTWQWQLHHLRW